MTRQLLELLWDMNCTQKQSWLIVLWCQFREKKTSLLAAIWDFAMPVPPESQQTLPFCHLRPRQWIIQRCENTVNSFWTQWFEAASLIEPGNRIWGCTGWNPHRLNLYLKCESLFLPVCTGSHSSTSSLSFGVLSFHANIPDCTREVYSCVVITRQRIIMEPFEYPHPPRL